jgi:tetratricopeptide (TPR) repeat protein
METSPTRALYERLALRGGGPGTRSNVAPFSDVMALGTVQQKQAVITMIADEFQPSFAPALRSALNDAEPAIRVQAATASARIENHFLERSMALEEQRAAAPDDPDVLLALARHHDEYADTDLLDTSRAQGERRQALEYYDRVERFRPGDPGVAEALGRLLLRLGQPERAVGYLEPLAEGGEASPAALASYLEGLYRLRRLGRLRAAARRLGKRIAASDQPEEVREAARLWAEGTGEDMRASALEDMRASESAP